MAAPPVTALGTPGGIKLIDGYPARLVFSLAPTIELWPKAVTPPNLDGGEAIEQTTHVNALYRTFAARSLITVGPVQAKCAFDPNTYTSLLALLNAKTGSVTVYFGDGSTVAVWAYLQKAEYQEMSEGNQPEVNITVMVTNFDPSNKVEAGPFVTSVVGT